jgi:anti-sigma B factor antagonist
MPIVSIDSDAAGALDVVLHGELDFTNASQVAGDVRKAIDDRRPPAVRVNLAAVTFLDSSGIGLLVQAMRAAMEISADFRVEDPTENVYDQLRCTGLLEAFGLIQPARGPT